jgi:hypothetical protein
MNPPSPPPEAVKKLLQVERAGRDIKKVLHLPARSRFGEGRAIPFLCSAPMMKNFNNRCTFHSFVTFAFRTTAFVKL